MAAITIPPLANDLAIGERAPARAAEPAPGASFSDTLGQAVASMEKLQVDADRDATQVALGSGNLHETALALEKADVALRVATKVRNKLIDAYQDIMRMSV